MTAPPRWRAPAAPRWFTRRDKATAAPASPALAHLRSTGPPAIVVFVDADYSDHPEELPLLVAPIVEDRADLVIGSRVLGRRERGAMLPQARAGNAVATLLIRLLYGHRFTDLGPFRAARWSSLEQLGMRDPDFGWTAEMQVKALRRGLRVIGGTGKLPPPSRSLEDHRNRERDAAARATRSCRPC